jgi:hypothetical protein
LSVAAASQRRLAPVRSKIGGLPRLDRKLGADLALVGGETDSTRRAGYTGFEHRRHVREIDNAHQVGFGEPKRIRVAVDRCDTQPELLRAQDRPALMAARADEENGPLHEPRCYSGPWD